MGAHIVLLLIVERQVAIVPIELTFTALPITQAAQVVVSVHVVNQVLMGVEAFAAKLAPGMRWARRHRVANELSIIPFPLMPLHVVRIIQQLLKHKDLSAFQTCWTKLSVMLFPKVVAELIQRVKTATSLAARGEPTGVIEETFDLSSNICILINDA